MDKLQRLQIIKRSLGLRHKLKVHDSMKAPETHEDLAVMLISKWELEDELRAIEEVLSEERHRNMLHKKALILKMSDDALEAEAVASAESIEKQRSN